MFGFGFLMLTPAVKTHTWVENVMIIGSDGDFVGNPGYARNHIGKLDPAVLLQTSILEDFLVGT
jgi:hypothetical protein